MTHTLLQAFRCAIGAIEAMVRRASSWVGLHPYFILTGIVLCGVVLRFGFIHFPSVPLLYTTDSFLYVLKAMEIVRGDWTPLLTHAYGISIALAPFLALFGATALPDAIMVATFFSVILGALLVIPTYFLARTVIGVKGGLVVAVLLTVHPAHVMHATALLTDILFTHAMLFSILAMVRGSKDIRFFYLVSIIAGCAYWLRSNGWFILCAGLFVFIVTHLLRNADALHTTVPRLSTRALLMHASMMTLLCVLIAFPMLHARYVTFGSAFTYGENDKIFAHDYGNNVWAPNIPTPTPLDFFREYGIPGVVEKFFVGGFLHVLLMTFFTSTPVAYPILFPFFMYGLFLRIRERAHLSMHLALFAYIALYSLVFDIMAQARFLFFLTPFLLSYSYVGGMAILKKMRYPSLTALCVIALLCVYAGIDTRVQMNYIGARPMEGSEGTYPAWSYWVSEHVRGTILVSIAGAYPFHHLPDTRVGGSSLFEYEAPETGLRARHYGSFDTIQEALIWHVTHHDATHLLVDSQARSSRPYLREVEDAITSGLLMEVYTESVGSDSVGVYAIQKGRVNDMRAVYVPHTVSH